MDQEKSMFSFDKKNRTFETRSFPLWVKMDHGWQEIEIPQTVITGWTLPVVREGRK